MEDRRMDDPRAPFGDGLDRSRQGHEQKPDATHGVRALVVVSIHVRHERGGPKDYPNRDEVAIRMGVESTTCPRTGSSIPSTHQTRNTEQGRCATTLTTSTAFPRSWTERRWTKALRRSARHWQTGWPITSTARRRPIPSPSATSTLGNGGYHRGHGEPVCGLQEP